MTNLSPTFVGIGGQKCASTWMSECLRRHPQVLLTTPKELRYFTDQRAYGIEWFLDHFVTTREGVVAAGEFSSNYLYDPGCAERILEALGPVRILAVVRDPVDRMLSHVKHLVRDGMLPQLKGEI